MNTAKAAQRTVFYADIAGWQNIKQGYLIGVDRIVLSEFEARRAADLRVLLDQVTPLDDPSQIVAFNTDLAGLRHIYQAYLLGVSTLILSDRECRRANKIIDVMEKELIGSGYMTEHEIQMMHVVPRRYLTQDDCKLPPGEQGKLEQMAAEGKIKLPSPFGGMN